MSEEDNNIPSPLFVLPDGEVISGKKMSAGEKEDLLNDPENPLRFEVHYEPVNYFLDPEKDSWRPETHLEGIDDALLGNRVYAVVTEDVAAGKFVNVNGSGETVTARLSSSSGKRVAHGFVLQAYLTGQVATVFLEGTHNTVLSGRASDVEYWLGEDGDITTDPVIEAGYIAQYIGYSVGSGILFARSPAKKTIDILPDPIIFTNEFPETLVVGVPVSFDYTWTGGYGAIGFTIDSGELPEGLSLSTGGSITGTPVKEEFAEFTVRAIDDYWDKSIDEEVTTLLSYLFSGPYPLIPIESLTPTASITVLKDISRTIESLNISYDINSVDMTITSQYTYGWADDDVNNLEVSYDINSVDMTITTAYVYGWADDDVNNLNVSYDINSVDMTVTTVYVYGWADDDVNNLSVSYDINSITMDPI